jgi:hypothetical protein
MNSNTTTEGRLGEGQGASRSGGDAPPDPRSYRLWLRTGLVVLAGYLILHIGLASLVNDFEGWANFVSNTTVIVVWGLVLGGLTFGLLVRWGLKPSPTGRNRAAIAATVAGAASVLCYATYFMWTPLVVAPAALLLAHEGLKSAGSQGGRSYALLGGILGAFSLGYWVFCMVFVLFTGTFPLPGPK